MVVGSEILSMKKVPGYLTIHFKYQIRKTTADTT